MSRVSATVSVALDVEVDGQNASISPVTADVDLTDLFKQRHEPVAVLMMPMKIEQAAGDIARSILERLGVKA